MHALLFDTEGGRLEGEALATQFFCNQREYLRQFEAHGLGLADHADQGQMVYDFGLLKGDVRDLIDAFDHAITFWDGDDADYIASCQRFSERWISLPVSPSAEQFSRVIFRLVDALLQLTEMINGEQDVRMHSVIVHETDTGYAQCFREDAYNPRMGAFELAQIEFSTQVKREWNDPQLFDRLLTALKP